LRGGSSHLEKKHVVYTEGGIPIYQCPNKEIPPQREHPLTSILSPLPSVNNTKGKAEKAFWVTTTLLAWPQPHAILPALKPKYLRCLQLVKVSISERTCRRKDSIRDIGLRRPGECWVSLEPVVSSGEGRKGSAFGKDDLLGTLRADMGKNPSGMCHNNRANTFPAAVLKGKDGARGVKGKTVTW
jgi:hypothetical protein